MTTRELIEELQDKPAWRFALAIYWRIVVGYLLAYLTLIAFTFLFGVIFTI